MNFIYKKLNDLYITPNEHLFKLLCYLNKAKNKILFAIFSLVIGYQVINIITIHLQEIDKTEEITNLNTQVTQLKNTYIDLINKNRELINQEHNITYINETIQKIMHKNGIKISNLDWHLEEDRSIDLKIMNTSNAIFSVISELNKLSYLKFNTLVLTKSEQNRQIELNATLVLIEHEE